MISSATESVVTNVKKAEVVEAKAESVETVPPQPKVKTVFNPEAVVNKELYLQDRPMPYKVKTNKEEIEM